MSTFMRRDPRLPKDVERTLELGRGERVLAFGVDENTGRHVVATTWRIIAASADHVELQREWSDVDAGQWDPDTWTLSVTWVDRSRAAQWTFTGQQTRIPEVVHERVQASVVLAAPLTTTGARASGRVVIRKNLQTQEMFTQTVLARATQADDPLVAAEIERVSADLRERIGW